MRENKYLLPIFQLRNLKLVVVFFAAMLLTCDEHKLDHLTLRYFPYISRYFIVVNAKTKLVILQWTSVTNESNIP